VNVAGPTDKKIDKTSEGGAFCAERVTIRFPIVVWGTDLMGKGFKDVGHTESITRNGATIVVKRLLGPHDTVRIVRASSRYEAMARVVGQTGILPDGNVYGVNIQDPDHALWGIKFPPLSERKRAIWRVLLQCRSCKAREVVYLDEIQSEVFETNNWLSRNCSHCPDWTRWFLAAKDVKAGKETMIVPANERTKSPEVSVDKRKHRRVNMQTNGCIREPGMEENIVSVVDVSRGGVKFRTLKEYYVHNWVEVAVPYTRGAANIFVPARITWAESGKPGEWNEYGLAYVKQSKEQLLEQLTEVNTKPAER
jgi:hypothetical protein